MNTEWDRLVDALAEVVKPPFQVIQREVDHQWYFCIGHCPTESESDEEPPGWLAEDSDVIEIDGVLGLYTPETQRIAIFRKGIERAAQRLGAGAADLQFVVRLHEWAHALIHVGLLQAECLRIGEDDTLWPGYLAQATAAFHAQDAGLHERLAQLLTYHGLRSLQAAATVPEAIAALERIDQTFQRLTRQAPREYHIHEYTDVPKHRIVRSIGLVKAQTLLGLAAWETVVMW